MWGLFIQFGAWLVGAFIAAAPSLVGQVLVSLGIAAVTYTGFSASIDWLKSSAVVALMGLPPEVVGMLSLMKVGSCISMIFSALLIRLALTGMASGTFKKMVTK